MSDTEEELRLKEELALVTHMSLIMEQRLEVVKQLALKAEFHPDDLLIKNLINKP